MILVFTGNGKGKTTAGLGQAMRVLGRGGKVLVIQFIKGPWESGENEFMEVFRQAQDVKTLRQASARGEPASTRTNRGEQAQNVALRQAQGIKEEDVGFQIKSMGLGFVGILGDKLPRQKHKEAAGKAVDFFKKEMKKNWDLIILDEINIAANLKLFNISNFLKILKTAPKEKIIILTGRYAPKSFIKIADLATEMKEIKHPFQKGAKGRKMVEY